MALNDLFHKVFVEKRNVYFSGSAGCGKTYAMKELYKQACGMGKGVALTAATGFAALNLGGQTLHRWAGILLGKGSVEQLVKLIRSNRRSLNKWLKVEILMIDEISMIGGTLFDKLDQIGRILRKNDEPFGGIQVIISGDFLQLEPINDKFVFKSNVWKEMNFHIHEFNTPYRYPDVNFYNLLQRARVGDLSDEDIKLLKDRVKPFVPDKETGIKPSILHSLNIDVAEANTVELAKLKGPDYRFMASDMIPKGLPEESVRKFLDSVVQPCLTFRIGAQVMLIKNVDPEMHLVNGSRGVVTMCDEGGVEVQFKRSKVYLTKDSFEFDMSDDPKGKKIVAVRAQIPLILAYSLTFHKIQGATLDCTIVNLGNSVFTTGMGYVALSRVRTLEGLYLSDFNSKKVRPNPEALEFVKSIKK